MRIFIFFFILCFAFAYSLIGGQHPHAVTLSPTLPLSLFALCLVITFSIQWLVFLPSFFFQTEKFYDLTGALTYTSLTLLILFITKKSDPRSLAIAFCVVVWALRLGSFLFLRIKKDRGDSRFDEIKPNFIKFLIAWTIQALWIVVTAGAAWSALTTTLVIPLNALGYLGLALWIFGFSFEVIADFQKRQFRSQFGSESFITTGLWSLCRHPNYFGEITLWVGVALLSFAPLTGWQHLTLISPLFVALLLTRLSGIPMLEKKAQKKWGHLESFRQYQRRTPRLIPFLL